MKLLDKYIIKSIFPPFVSGVMIFTLLISSGGLLFEMAKIFIKREASFFQVVKLFLLGLPDIMVLTLPMALLLGILISFGKFSENGELTAFRASGISLSRIVLSVVIFSLLPFFLMFWGGEYLVPFATSHRAKLMRDLGLVNISKRDFIGKVHVGDIDRIIYAKFIDLKKGVMKDILIQEVYGDDIVRIIRAKKAVFSDGNWIFIDGAINELDRDGELVRILKFSQDKIGFDLSPEKIYKVSRSSTSVSLRELYSLIKKAGDKKTKKILEVKFYQKLSLPFSCIVFSILGMSISFFPVFRGSSWSFGLTILIVFFYYIMFSVIGAMGEAMVLSPVLVGTIPIFTFLTFGLVLLYKVEHL